MMMFRFSIEKLDEFSAQFWKEAGNTKLFAFHGEMGAGKTTIIMALCRAKGVKDVMSSPTFSIINEYLDADGQKIFHMDLYRLKDEEEIIQAGVEDCLNSGAVCMVEWPEKAPDLFDEETAHVYISTVTETEREVELKLPSLH